VDLWYLATMRRMGLLALGLLLLAAPALAKNKKGSGTLAREAVPGRLARLAEIAKDASPPKPGTSKQREARRYRRPSDERRPAQFGYY
jgi:hypothetical protein